MKVLPSANCVKCFLKADWVMMAKVTQYTLEIHVMDKVSYTTFQLCLRGQVTQQPLHLMKSPESLIANDYSFLCQNIFNTENRELVNKGLISYKISVYEVALVAGTGIIHRSKPASSIQQSLTRMVMCGHVQNKLYGKLVMFFGLIKCFKLTVNILSQQGMLHRQHNMIRFHCC